MHRSGLPQVLFEATQQAHLLPTSLGQGPQAGQLKLRLMQAGGACWQAHLHQSWHRSGYASSIAILKHASSLQCLHCFRHP